MEVERSEQSPYEVRCQRCRVSFPLGTRTCLHCGERIRPRRGAGPAIAEAPPELQDILTEEETLQEPSLARRLSGVSLWVLIAIGATVYRSCGGAG